MNDPEENAPEEFADWMAIILQFLFGAVVGGGVVFYEFLRYGFVRGGSHSFILISSLAGAIFLGSIAALFGDGTWGVSFRVLPNMPIRHSRGSRFFFGLLMIAAALMPGVFWFFHHPA